MDYRNSKILITGGNGFLGKHVVNELKSSGYTDLLTPTSKELNLLNPIFDCPVPDIVIHLAAVVGGIGANKENPGRFFYENMLMGLNLIHWASLVKVKKFIFLSTVCSFPHTPPHIPFVVDDLWESFPEKTNAPYGIAKKSLSLMGDAYREQYGLNFVTIIPTNLFGPGDNFSDQTSHVIPAVIKKIDYAIKTKEAPVFWGDGTASRDFLYVKDCASFIRIVLENYDESRPLLIGSGKEFFIKELVETISKLMNYNGEVKWDVAKPNGQPRRCLNLEETFKFLNDKKIKWNNTDIMEALLSTINSWTNA